MNKVLFSVVIPTLNEEKYLPELLEDLSRQTFRDFEVVIVDGKSKDKTVSNALKFSDKLPSVNIVVSKKRNVAVQRNLGGKAASGKWLIFMDADNRLPVYFLEGVKYRINLTPPDVFTCWCSVDGNDTTDKVVERFLNITGEIARLIEYQSALGAMIGITKKGFEKTRGFDSKKVPLEDGKFVRDAVKKGLDFKIFRDPKYVYSLRRFRRGGKLKALQTYAKLHLKKLSNLSYEQKTDYPMGGDHDAIEREARSIFGDIQHNLKVLAKKPQVRKRLRSLLAAIENGF